ncbi:MAG: hypothetical protein JW984_01860 [Deltaproteobacteria bacterium]|uniref:Uncharacterized protein n=1 Tax=Candidatus Zymogenus saltonus TaxID=2844893 RepID=A0A9D8PNC6_9DELT|nr:hypothetical protein [Candidatus Zymogenus saltonus]
MKKNAITVILVIFTLIFFGCRSTPKVYAPPKSSPVKYKIVYIEFEYSPEYLITVFDKRDIIDDLTKRINDLGFLVTIKPERADMTLKINIDALILPDRNARLKDRTTFGLAEGEAMMKYTAAFTDNKTFKDITETTETYKTSEFFPSKDELKEKFFSEMKDNILKFMSQYKGF